MNLPILLAETADAASGINWHSFFFLLFAIVACVMALAVLFSSNIVRMAFYLTISLGAVSGLFILAGAHFVGAMQLLIYVGGTLVLLIFGVMLTAQAQFIEMKTRGGEWILAAIVGGSLLSVLLAAAFNVDSWRGPGAEHAELAANMEVESYTTSLGAALVGLRMDRLSEENEQLRRGLSGYFIHFEIVSVHLLVVLIGAAFLARARMPVEQARPRPAPTERPARRRGIFITAVLFLAAVYHAVNGGFSFYIAGAGFESLVQDALVQGAPVPAPESWLWPALGIVNFAFALGYITILRWQQWGFFALCILAVVQSALCYAADAGALPTLAVLGAGVVWLAILFGLLRIGGPRSVWAQME